MADAGVRIKGVETLMRTLRAAGKSLADMPAANARVASLIAAAASARAPRRTGRLAGSIRPLRQSGGATVVSPLPYAGPIHWGWPVRNIAAQPFLARAAEASEDTAISLYGDDVQRVLDQVKGA